MAALVLTVAYCFVLFFSCAECSKSDGKIFSAFFSNQAQYYHCPYTFLPRNLDGIVSRLDHLVYAYAAFDLKNYTITLTDANDTNFLAEIVQYKTNYPYLKILISVGGPYFPSSNFSRMVSSKDNRNAFVSGLKSFLTEFGLDGVDLSWHYPCSRPRTIYLERSCEDITALYDSGGSCPDDSMKFLLLVREMREKLGKRVLITVSGPPGPDHWKKMKLQLMSYTIDYWNVATYDYTVSAKEDSYVTAPNAPLIRPSSVSQVRQMSINTTGDAGRRQWDKHVIQNTTESTHMIPSHACRIKLAIIYHESHESNSHL